MYIYSRLERWTGLREPMRVIVARQSSRRHAATPILIATPAIGLSVIAGLYVSSMREFSHRGYRYSYFGLDAAPHQYTRITLARRIADFILPTLRRLFGFSSVFFASPNAAPLIYILDGSSLSHRANNYNLKSDHAYLTRWKTFV